MPGLAPGYAVMSRTTLLSQPPRKIFHCLLKPQDLRMPGLSALGREPPLATARFRLHTPKRTPACCEFVASCLRTGREFRARERVACVRHSKGAAVRLVSRAREMRTAHGVSSTKAPPNGSDMEVSMESW